MRVRSIPPRTMSTLSRERPLTRLSRGGRRPAGASSDGTGIQVTPLKKPRHWQYQTRPSFKRVRGPLVDVFNEAEEVLIVVDLGGFTRGEISLNITPEQYILQAKRGEQLFSEFIDLPPNVDVEHSQERLINGVLEIILPRKKNPPSGRRIPRGR